MINFLTITDPHFAGVGPKAYLPNPGAYKHDILAILSECADLAKEHNCAAVLMPGDLTNSHIMSTAVLTEFVEALKKFPCPILAITGNHDIETTNLEDTKNAPYGLLKAAGVIHDVYEKPFRVGSVVVTGHPYTEETDINIEQYCNPGVSTSLDDCTVHLVHGMILKEPPCWAKDKEERPMRFTTLEQLNNLPSGHLPQIIICGHNHDGIGAAWVKDSLVVNYGSIARLTRAVGEIKRVLNVGLVTIESSRNYRAKEIVLQSQRPGHECLSREELIRELERQKTKDKMSEFLNLLGTKREIRTRDAKAVVLEAVKELKLSPEIGERCIKRIESVAARGEASEK